MQEKVWDREYKNSKFLTKENKPQSDVVRFVKWLKKEGIVPTWTSDVQVLDLGSGTGRNSLYFAEFGAHVVGLEISDTALKIAKKNLKSEESLSYDISYDKRSIGDVLPFGDNRFDILLDVTSSNSLGEKEREIFLSEAHRVLKKGGVFFTKALCKDGDLNAKELLKKFPGEDRDTYIMPDTGIVERVWSREDLTETYGKYFRIVHLEKKTSYTRMNDRSYKRNFLIVYFQK